MALSCVSSNLDAKPRGVWQTVTTVPRWRDEGALTASVSG